MKFSVIGEGNVLHALNRFIPAYAAGYAKICAKLGDKDAIYADGDELHIEFDKNNVFIKNGDPDCIKILVLRKLLISGFKMDAPEIIAKLLADRKIMSEGFSRELVCYYYCDLITRKMAIENLEDFLEVNLPWLSFSRADRYNSEFFRQLAGMFPGDEFEAPCEKLLGLLAKPMTSSALNNAISEYRTVENTLKHTDRVAD